MRFVLLLSMLLSLQGCKCGKEKNWDGTEAEQHVVLDTVTVAGKDVRFYEELGVDSAVLGFSVEGGKGDRRYFPMYASTYRGLPSGELEIYASESGEEMWVRSTWPGYEVLAYHRLGTDRCMTTYGDTASIDEPMPATLGGGLANFPPMEGSSVTRVATIKLP